jgi:hypothetical protein
MQYVPPLDFSRLCSFYGPDGRRYVRCPVKSPLTDLTASESLKIVAVQEVKWQSTSYKTVYYPVA